MHWQRFSVAVLAPVLAPMAVWGASPVTLTGTVRDFSDTQTDFEQFNFNDVTSLPSQYLPAVLGGIDQRLKVEPGIVQSTLGADGAPVYQGGTDPTFFKTTHSSASFNQWFHDVMGVNESKPLSITLNPLPNSNILQYTSPAVPDTGAGFFPIDNQLLGNQGQDHNYDFTTAFHATFTYEPGQAFTYIGTDDAFVFVDKKLAIDLGGVHDELAGSTNLDTLALTPGKTYGLDLFTANRNRPDSTFTIDTTIAFNNATATVPLPNAAWMSLTVLGGLAAISGAGKVRRILVRG